MSETTVTDATKIDELCVNAIRILTMDAVQKANSGHPGAAMSLAPAAYVLFKRHLRHNPANPAWSNRDRFVLSCGHASMLLYSLLHLSGYDLPRFELESFRQWGSRTPGHPEHGMTPGVETTTGPLGQGVANAVGMALAEAQLAGAFNETGHYIVDHHTYFIASDGDLMEGISHEAASLAGHWKLDKLIGFYDDNRITIEGERSLADSEDVAARFAGYGWQVLRVEDGNDLAAIDDAVDAGKAELDRPTLIVLRTEIAFGSPNKQNSSAAHGAPLGADEVRLARETLGWPSAEPFAVPDEVRGEWLECKERGAELEAAWRASFAKYRNAFPAETEELERRLGGDLPGGWEDALADLAQQAGPQATRAASGEALNAIAAKVPELVGGSADLAPSNNTWLAGEEAFAATERAGRNLHLGVREHAMGAIQNGVALHGGLIPFAGTFLVFADYMRPAIRLAALMELGTIYVFTHDSIGLGEDGPTHQPVEHCASLRLIPGLCVIRPADAAETREAWRVALTRSQTGPTALILTRQKVPQIERENEAALLRRGGYVCVEADGGEPRLVLIATGSELALAVEARAELEAQGIATRVVSMPSLELFAAQDEAWRDEVLPRGIARLAVEAAHPMPWYRWVGDKGAVLGIERFGASAPADRLFSELGITTDRVVELGRGLVKDPA